MRQREFITLIGWVAATAAWPRGRLRSNRKCRWSDISMPDHQADMQFT